MLDETDKKLLNLLQKDASITHKQLAAELNLTVTPVYERIKKLKKSGVIKRITAEIDRNKVNKPVMVFCEVSLSSHTLENLKKFEKEVLGLQEVLESYHVSGEYDYMLKVLIAGMEEYREFLINKLAKLKNVGHVNSTFVMKPLREERFLQL
ncbi:MAG: Lrp/AsnC family transcriptional regulator [Crocinitomicaceae bacterium]